MARGRYVVVAYAGFYTFGDRVDSDILNNYPQTNLLSYARIAIVLLVTFSYPLQSHPARRCALSLYSALVLGDDELGEPRQPGLVPFYVSSSIFAFGSYGLALILDDLGIVRWVTYNHVQNDHILIDLCPIWQ